MARKIILMIVLGMFLVIAPLILSGAYELKICGAQLT